MYKRQDYGIGILSKREPLRTVSGDLPGTEARKFFLAEFDDYIFIATHLCHLETTNRAQSVEIINAYIAANYASYTKPIFLAGDFNDTPSSYTYREMKGALTDGFRRCGNGYGGTFRYLGGLLRIDYIFYDDTFECVRYYMPSETVSDHKVVIAELRFK